MGHKTSLKARAKTCPVTTFRDLFTKAVDHIRDKVDRWEESALVPLDYDVFRPKTPKRLRLATDVWARTKTPPVLLEVGLGREHRGPWDWKSTHLHGDLEVGATRPHIDYFYFSNSLAV